MSGPVSAVAPVTDSLPPLNRAPVFRTTVRIEKNRGHHGNDHWRLRHRARRHLAFPAEPQRPHASRRRGARGGVLRQRLQRQPDDPAGRRLPAQGEDTLVMRTYNSRGSWNANNGQGWAINTIVLNLSQITANKITLVNPDSSQFLFFGEASGTVFRSTDGSGAYQTICQYKTKKQVNLTRSD